jgi:predicted nucleic acid-binding protein
VIYLDTCVIISAIENEGAVGERARQALTELSTERFAVSPLVAMEALVVPIRHDNYRLRLRYEKFFESLEMLELDEPTLVRAAELRARHSLSLGEAMHLACAQVNLCEGFWTNDKRLNKIAGGLSIRVLPTTSASSS